MKISKYKELLSEVLGEKIDSLQFTEGVEPYSIGSISYWSNCCSYSLTAEVLSSKCKEWAIKKKGYAIMTSENQDGVSVKLFSRNCLTKEFLPVDSKEYIFNYCRWIFENDK
jgi:hypothetical protein